MRPFHHTTITYILTTLFYLSVMFVKDLGWLYLLPLTGVFLLLLVLGSINIQWNFYFFSYNKARHKKWVSLTFDDGPADQTVAILDILKEHQVRATFFAIGNRAASNTNIVKRWDSEGHIIGNHSYHHGFNFDWQSSAKMASEICQTNDVIEAITGKRPKLFRPPYGVTNPNLGRALRICNMHSIGWNVRSFDTKARDERKLLARILRKVKGGDVILLHDSMAITQLVLTDLIVELRRKGFSFVTIDTLFDIEPYEKSE